MSRRPDGASLPAGAATVPQSHRPRPAGPGWRDRLGVTARSLAAVLGGYALAAGCAAGGALLLALVLPRVEAVLWATMAAWLVYALVVGAAFWVGRREGFRQAMAWVHTWAGLVLGWLLFAIFVTGALAFFRAEFNLWMRPELHGLPHVAVSAAAGAGAGADAATADHAIAALRGREPGVVQWILSLPDAREPEVKVLWRNTPNGRFQTSLMDPVSGALLAPRDTMGGEFFYRFHFELRTAKASRWALQGRWIVGAATLAMFIALLTGVVTHRRLFKDFFTFRPAKGGQRAWLDAHNATGVLVLPFYLVITFSGLMIFHTQYLPAGIAAAYAGPKGVDSATYFADLVGDKAERRLPRGAAPEAVAPLPVLALAPIVEAARAHWAGGRVGTVQARRDPGGRVLVEVGRHDGDRLQYRPERLLFDGATGRLVEALDAPSPAVQTYGVLYGLHMARFAGPGLRWALFGFGVLGSLMIATGLVLWSVKRRSQALARAKGQPAPPLRGGERLVATLNLAALAGLPLALAAYLLANRLLPLDLPARADAELHSFFIAWGGALLVAALWPRRGGWAALLGLAGAAWLALPLVNALTTPAHLGVTLPAGDWAWAGMDLSFAAAGALLLALAAHLARRRPAARAAARHGPAAPAGALR